jgi:hypothetical protein
MLFDEKKESARITSDMQRRHDAITLALDRCAN